MLSPSWVGRNQVRVHIAVILDMKPSVLPSLSVSVEAPQDLWPQH